MLLDALTFCVRWDGMSDADAAAARAFGDRICRFDPSSGDLQWTVNTWNPIKADDHTVAMKAGVHGLWINGSPQRCFSPMDQVFGHADSRLSIYACMRAMVDVVNRSQGWRLPDPALGRRFYHVTKADIAQNFVVERPEDVDTALRALGEIRTGRHAVRPGQGGTQYFGRNALRGGKAYNKGQQIRHELKRGKSVYTAQQYELADHLLRLEMTLGGQYWREWAKRGHPVWYEHTAEHFEREWHAFWDAKMSDESIADLSETELRRRVHQAAPTTRAGNMAWSTWLMIQADGFEPTRAAMTESTWYRHRAILRAAGITDGDFSRGKAASMPVRQIRATPVNDWHELRAA